jgi:hypothetical protein
MTRRAIQRFYSAKEFNKLDWPFEICKFGRLLNLSGWTQRINGEKFKRDFMVPHLCLVGILALFFAVGTGMKDSSQKLHQNSIAKNLKAGSLFPDQDVGAYTRSRSERFYHVCPFSGFYFELRLLPQKCGQNLRRRLGYG